MKVTISYKMFGAIELDLDEKEIQELGKPGVADDFLNANYDLNELKRNLDPDSDATVITNVSTDETTIYEGRY